MKIAGKSIKFIPEKSLDFIGNCLFYYSANHQSEAKLLLDISFVLTHPLLDNLLYFYASALPAWGVQCTRGPSPGNAGDDSFAKKTSFERVGTRCDSFVVLVVPFQEWMKAEWEPKKFEKILLDLSVAAGKLSVLLHEELVANPNSKVIEHRNSDKVHKMFDSLAAVAVSVYFNIVHSQKRNAVPSSLCFKNIVRFLDTSQSCWKYMDDTRRVHVLRSIVALTYIPITPETPLTQRSFSDLTSFVQAVSRFQGYILQDSLHKLKLKLKEEGNGSDAINSNISKALSESVNAVANFMALTITRANTQGVIDKIPWSVDTAVHTNFGNTVLKLVNLLEDVADMTAAGPAAIDLLVDVWHLSRVCSGYNVMQWSFYDKDRMLKVEGPLAVLSTQRYACVECIRTRVKFCRRNCPTSEVDLMPITATA